MELAFPSYLKVNSVALICKPA
ncbi:hypothetical protein SBDP1_860004 [Syntrophobacter sp. SbD1]|nr:hypothetical protein SBDP1_860004 [Syntrophobacter sp. SbD1]